MNISNQYTLLLKHTAHCTSSIWPPLFRARWLLIFLNCSDLDWSERAREKERGGALRWRLEFLSEILPALVRAFYGGNYSERGRVTRSLRLSECESLSAALLRSGGLVDSRYGVCREPSRYRNNANRHDWSVFSVSHRTESSLWRWSTVIH